MRGWPLALALVVFAGCGGDRAVDEPSDAAAVGVVAHDAGAFDAAASDDGGAPLIACQWSGVPGTCITTSACAAIVDHTSEPGSDARPWRVTAINDRMRELPQPLDVLRLGWFQAVAG